MNKRNKHGQSSEAGRDDRKRGPTTADLRGIAAPEIRDDRRHADRRRDSGERRLDRLRMGQDLELNPDELGASADDSERDKTR